MKLDIKDLDKLQDGIQDLVQKGVQKGVDGLNKGIDYINNLDGSAEPGQEKKAPVEDVPSICPKCGANLNLNNTDDFIVCEYCGASFENKKPNDTVNTILNFVEKQQTKLEEKAEREKEEKRLRRIEHQKRKRKKALIKLPIIVVILIVIYYCISSGTININEIIQSIPYLH